MSCQRQRQTQGRHLRSHTAAGFELMYAGLEECASAPARSESANSSVPKFNSSTVEALPNTGTLEHWVLQSIFQAPLGQM